MLCALALVLLLDASASILPAEWRAQQEGHAAALEDAEIHAAIAREGPVAIAVLAFSDDVRPMLDWRVIQGPADARAAAAALRLAARPTPLGTDIGAALWAGLDLLATAPCQAEREVMDLVTDGEAPVEGVLRARAYAEAQGVTINALAVGPEAAEAWLRANAATPSGFVLRADGWASFAPALRRKLLMEMASRHAEGVQAMP